MNACDPCTDPTHEHTTHGLTIIPVRFAVIQGVTARIFEKAPTEFTTVQSAADADRVLGDDGNEHHCPLCNEFFGTQAFKRHAPSCIQANAPAWERQRDREPIYAKQKRFNVRRLFLLGGHNESP